MVHSSNGRHQRGVLETRSKVSTAFTHSQPESVMSKLESTVQDTHELVIRRSTEFIRERPGVSLLLAVAIGGVVGWLIKRRG